MGRIIDQIRKTITPLLFRNRSFLLTASSDLSHYGLQTFTGFLGTRISLCCSRRCIRYWNLLCSLCCRFWSSGLWWGIRDLLENHFWPYSRQSL